MTNEAIIRGDIFIARIPKPADADHLLYGSRPVVCVSHLDTWGRLVTVIPMQRIEPGREAGPYDLTICANRVNRLDSPGSIVRTGQIRTIPAEWLQFRLGRVSDAAMLEIERCIASYLDFTKQ